MLVQLNEKVKVIASATPEEFESRLNSFLAQLKRNRQKYELQINPTAGLLAFVNYYEEEQIPETIADEFELLGERHTCSECPFFMPITDKRCKHSKCKLTGRVRGIDCPACDDYYKTLLEGDKGE